MKQQRPSLSECSSVHCCSPSASITLPLHLLCLLHQWLLFLLQCWVFHSRSGVTWRKPPLPVVDCTMTDPLPLCRNSICTFARMNQKQWQTQIVMWERGKHPYLGTCDPSGFNLDSLFQFPFAHDANGQFILISAVCHLGVGIDKFLSISMPLSILPINPIPYQFSYWFLSLLSSKKRSSTQSSAPKATILYSSQNDAQDCEHEHIKLKHTEHHFDKIWCRKIM